MKKYTEKEIELIKNSNYYCFLDENKNIIKQILLNQVEVLNIYIPEDNYSYFLDFEQNYHCVQKSLINRGLLSSNSLTLTYLHLGIDIIKICEFLNKYVSYSESEISFDFCFSYFMNFLSENNFYLFFDSEKITIEKIKKIDNYQVLFATKQIKILNFDIYNFLDNFEKIANGINSEDHSVISKVMIDFYKKSIF